MERSVVVVLWLNGRAPWNDRGDRRFDSCRDYRMLSIYSQIPAMESHEPAKANPNKPGATPCGLDAKTA